MKLRVGIVGLGDSWETRHRPALRALSDRFEVRAICCEVAHLAAQAAREFHAVPVDGYRDLCARQDVEAILILNAEWYGHLPILAACEFGKSVYCSTALDIDAPAEAELVRSRVERSGITLMIEFARRVAPATVRLKELIATRLGKPKLLFCHRRSGADDASSARRSGRTAPSLHREMAEQVDWCRYVAGQEPTSVVGIHHGNVGPGGCEDYQMMSLDFSPAGALGAGPTAQISCGRYMPAAWPEAVSFRPPAALQVCCEHGIAFVDLPSTLTWFDAAGRHMESLESERPVGERLLMQFYRSVTSLLLKGSDITDAYRAMAVVSAARQSFATGNRIKLAF